MNVWDFHKVLATVSVSRKPTLSFALVMQMILCVSYEEQRILGPIHLHCFYKQSYVTVNTLPPPLFLLTSEGRNCLNIWLALVGVCAHKFTFGYVNINIKHTEASTCFKCACNKCMCVHRHLCMNSLCIQLSLFLHKMACRVKHRVNHRTNEKWKLVTWEGKGRERKTMCVRTCIKWKTIMTVHKQASFCLAYQLLIVMQCRPVGFKGTFRIASTVI